MRFKATMFLSVVSKALITLPITIICNIVRICLLAYKRGLPIGQYFLVALIRSLMATFTPHQIQWIIPSGSKTCLAWLKKQQQKDEPLRKNLRLDVHPLPRTCGTLHWFSNSAQTSAFPLKVLLFFHGGGYAIPMADAHLEWCFEHMRTAHQSSINLSVAILKYSLTPDSAYPTQLSQAAEALQFILSQGVRPKNIIIGGDSAGGNLTFALLGHLLHPHPEIQPVRLNEPLAGAFGISPWVTLDISASSFGRNHAIDLLSPALIKQSARDFVGHSLASKEIAQGQGWSMPLDVPGGWFDGLSRVVRKVFINTGVHEMFYDHVVSFVEFLRASDNERALDVVLDIGMLETHDHVLLYFILGEREGRAVKALMGWVSNTLA